MPPKETAQGRASVGLGVALAYAGQPSQSSTCVRRRVWRCQRNFRAAEGENGTSRAATSSPCCASALRPLYRLLRAPPRALRRGLQRLDPWPSPLLESQEKRVRREKEGHGMIAPGGPSAVIDVWTCRSRCLAVAAELASSTFVPKSEKGNKDENLGSEERRHARSGSSVRKTRL